METWMIEHAVGRRDKGEDDFFGQALVFNPFSGCPLKIKLREFHLFGRKRERDKLRRV